MRTRPTKKAPATANQQPVVAPQRTTAGEKQARAGALLAAAKRPRLTGTAQEAAERKGVEEGLWGTAPQTTTSLGGAHVVIIKGLLPDAEALLAEERDTWTHTDKERDTWTHTDTGDETGSPRVPGRQTFRAQIPEGAQLALAAT